MERYEIKAKLGEGGSGTVYRAWDTQEKRAVAIKRLAPPQTGPGQPDPEAARAALMREASFLSSLKHPAICRVLDFGIDEEGGYAVLELANGETLEQAAARQMTAEEFADVASQLLDALHHAHQKGLVHGDLKPSNIMLNWKPGRVAEVKLIDFGLARFTPRFSNQEIDRHSGTTLGSIYYMAPEQFERGPLDARADLYSLGCVAYYTLTGKPPFDGENTLEIQQNHNAHRLAAPLAQLRPDLPQHLRQWVHWLMNRMPQDRPQSALEALESLKELGILPQPATATITVPLQRAAAAPILASTEDDTPSRPWLPWVIAGGVAALAIGGFAFFKGGKEPEKAIGAPTINPGEAAKEEPKVPAPMPKPKLASSRLRSGENLSVYPSKSPEVLAAAIRVSPPPSQPAQQGLVLWLDAAKGIQSASGDNIIDQEVVVRWKDQAPEGGQNDAVATDPAEGPLWNASSESHGLRPLPALSYRKEKKSRLTIGDKYSDSLGEALKAGNGTLLCVFRASKGDSGQQRAIHSRLEIDPRSSFGFSANDEGVLAGWRWNRDEADKLEVQYPNSSNKFRMLSFWWQDKANPEGSETGIRVIRREGTQHQPESLKGFERSAAFSTLHIGATAEDTEHFAGEFAEILLYNRRLSEAELVQVEAYLHNKYFEM